MRIDDPGWIVARTSGRSVQLALIVPGLRLPRASPLVLPKKWKNQSAAKELSLGDLVPTPKQRRWLTPQIPKSTVSPHLVDPAQTVLFEARRDWSRFTVGSMERLPSLTPAAEALLEEFRRHAGAHGWNPTPRNAAAMTLRILLGWLGAQAPIHEADIRAVGDHRHNASIRRVLQFLDTYGMVVPDPARHGEAAQRAVDQRIAALPDPIAIELRCWIRVLRGEGRHPHPEFPFATIRSYLNCLRPALAAWTEQVTSLREITRDDIQAALDRQPPVTARNLLSALHSLFRALKQERVIFRDPTRGISLPAMRRLPAPIPTDRLRGLIDRADGPMAKLVVALIAVHGLGKQETAQLLLDDLDLAAGRLLVRRDTRHHTVYLDEITHTLSSAWLHERRRLWGRTANRHLFVSQVTAADATLPPVSHRVMDTIFERLGLPPSQLRRDRILDEASHTADPVHLMHVFGISAKTAMTYVQAAHPERRSTGPR
ncbi:site-specific integrase [Mycobacterium riyadhense]|uniref:site-specific integrase n=2 Tax=Mycobacterium riyadhense TaxID=486698 RepID=UPI001958592C|nr:site-specific integrase [Mycobacterium riyadhense]